MKASSKIILLLNGISLGLLFPVLSMALLYKGFSLSELAIVMGIFSLCAFLMEVPSGILADIFGRKRIFILANSFNIAASLLYIFLHGYWTILAVVMWASGKAFTSGSLDALLIDRFIEDNGTEKLPAVTGTLALLETVSLAAGSILGGFLPALTREVFPALGTYDLNLMAKCAIGGIILLLSCLFLKEEPKIRSAVRRGISEHIKKSALFVRGNKTVLLLIAGVFCAGFFISTIETYWQPAFVNMTGENLLYLLGIVACGCFAFAAAGNFAMKAVMSAGRAGWTAVYSIARIVLAVCMIAFAMQFSAIGFCICFLLLYFLFGAANMAESTVLNREIPSEIRAGFLSFISFVFQGGAMIAPVLSTLIVLRRGISSLWLYTGIFLLVSSTAIGLLMWAKPKAAGEYIKKAVE